jgi:hypothetical protein
VLNVTAVSTGDISLFNQGAAHSLNSNKTARKILPAAPVHVIFLVPAPAPALIIHRIDGIGVRICVTAIGCCGSR